MEVQYECFREFPHQCEGCPNYFETRQDNIEHMMWMAGAGFSYPQYLVKIVKECRAFGKRVIEYKR